MSRLSFRPRPLDIHRKLPIVKSVRDLEDEETPSSTRNSQLLRLVDHEVVRVPGKRVASEIPIPQFTAADTYERDYSPTFSQPTSYIRARGARAELGEYVEYDLDDEDLEWLHEFNKGKTLIAPEWFESIMFKFEVLDHKARERAGIITPTLGSPIPVVLQFDVVSEALMPLSGVLLQPTYSYWKEKRNRWKKPILRRLQPPPPANDTNPYNVFRPREKINKLNTRRMQRRENNVHSFEKLRQVRRNLDQSMNLLQALIKREEKKRQLMESEVSLQRTQMNYKIDTELLEHSLALPGFPSFAGKFSSLEEEYLDSDDAVDNKLHIQPYAVRDSSLIGTNQEIARARALKRELKAHGWLHKLDCREPILLFTKPLDPGYLSAAGIPPPPDSSTSQRSCNFRRRIGRGGRIVCDRWNPLMNTPIDVGDSFYLPPTSQHLSHNY